MNKRLQVLQQILFKKNNQNFILKSSKLFLFFIFSFSFLNFGCNQKVAELVGRRENSNKDKDNETPIVNNNTAAYLKISSGSNTAVGTNIKSKFSFSVDKRIAQGNQVKSQFTFHQNRVE